MRQPGPDRPSASERLYDLLLRVYPASFRGRFDAGLRYCFSAEMQQARERGPGSVAWFWVRTLAYTVLCAVQERVSPSGAARGPKAPSFANGRKRGSKRMSEMMREFRYGLRRLLRSPWYSLAVVVTLGLGIGATTAIFSVVHGVLLKSLPYEEPDRIVQVGHQTATDRLGMPNAGYFQYSEKARSFSDFALYLESSAPVVGTGAPLELGVIVATPSLFDVLRVKPILGRAFTEEDALPGVPDIALLSYDFWMSRFDGDPDVLGKPFVKGSEIPVVGVLPKDFTFVRPEARHTFGNRFKVPDIYIPLTLRKSTARFGNFMYHGIGRLAPGVTPADAVRELDELMMAAPEAYPGGHSVASLKEGEFRTFVSPLKEAMVGSVSFVLWVLFGAVGFVLLIATANVANLFLVRAESRRGEMAVRRALGASRGALSRTFLSESVLLSALGGALGIALAALGTRMLLQLAPSDIPRLDQVAMDGRVLVFAAAISILAGLACGMLPLVRHVRADLSATLGEGHRSATAGRSRQKVRDALVTAQVALALVLLVGSGLLLRTFSNLRNVAPGFDSSNVLTLRLSLAGNVLRSVGITEERDDVGRSRFMLEVTRRLEALPGVEKAAFSGDLPLDGDEWRDHVAVEGAFPEGDTLGSIALRVFMGPGYLDAIGARLVSGREMERADFEGHPGKVVVNQTFAQQRWPGEDPLGKRLVQWPIWKPEHTPWYTVVGVVEDVREASLMSPAEATIYLPTVFGLHEGFSMFVRNMALVLKISGDPVAILPAVRREILAYQPEVPINSVETLASLEARSFQQVSFAMVLLLIASGVAVTLGVVGIYGLVAYVVSQRTREFGLRIALGATSGNLRWSVLRQGGLIGLLGIAVGVAGALASGRLVQSMLFGVSSADLAIYAAVSGGLFLVVLLASLLPAQRATRVDPVEAMKVE